LNPTKYMSSQVVLGAAFFTNFFAQFEYQTDSDQNYVRLTLAKLTVPGTYLGDQTGTVDPYDPIPTPTPVPDVPTPSVDPTPTVVNGTESSGNSETVNILLVSGEVIVLMCIMACMIYICVNKTTCCKSKPTINDYNQVPSSRTSGAADDEAKPFTPQ